MLDRLARPWRAYRLARADLRPRRAERRVRRRLAADAAGRYMRARGNL